MSKYVSLLIPLFLYNAYTINSDQQMEKARLTPNEITIYKHINTLYENKILIQKYINPEYPLEQILTVLAKQKNILQAEVTQEVLYQTQTSKISQAFTTFKEIIVGSTRLNLE